MLSRQWFFHVWMILAALLLLTPMIVRVSPISAAQLTAAAAKTWYFAEGFTGAGFDEYLTIMNPGAAGSATITYSNEGQATPATRTVPLAANSRTTIAVHGAQAVGNPGGLGRLAVGHSTRVQATIPIVVERPMYFTYGAGTTGGHNVMGAPAARRAWYFAEGYTGTGFDEYLTIMNPDAAATFVTITYYRQGAGPVSKTTSIAGNARATIAVHDETMGVGRNGGVGWGVAAKVESPSPIVIERPLYFVYAPGIADGHTVVGFAP